MALQMGFCDQKYETLISLAKLIHFNYFFQKMDR